MTSTHPRLLLPWVLWGLSLLPAPAAGCTCTAFLTFEELFKSAPTVWIVRVESQGIPKTSIQGGDPVAYVDAEIVRVVKGSAGPRHVRIWDAEFGSDCPAGLTGLTPDSLAVVIVRQESIGPDHHMWFLWSLVPDPPGRDAYFVDGLCGKYWRLLRTEMDADPVVNGGGLSPGKRARQRSPGSDKRRGDVPSQSEARALIPVN